MAGNESAEVRGMHKRPLPSTCITLASTEGQQRFTQALLSAHARTFFALVSSVDTQAEPAFCGLSSITVTLNALNVDPLRTSLGPWRFWRESLLQCCVDFDSVRQRGISLKQAAYLARCNGAATKMRYALSDTVQYAPDATVEDGWSECSRCEAFRTLRRASSDAQAALALQEEWHSIGGEGTIDEFRKDVIESCTHLVCEDAGTPDSVVIASYSRAVLGQTGSGHFSPIGAYDDSTDSVLILDTARFKYPAHWVNTELLFHSMTEVDESTGKQRGWIRAFQQHARLKQHCCSSDNTCSSNRARS